MITLIATGWPYLATILTLGSITGAAWAWHPRPDDTARLRAMAAANRRKVALAVAEREADEAFERVIVHWDEDAA